MQRLLSAGTPSAGLAATLRRADQGGHVIVVAVPSCGPSDAPADGEAESAAAIESFFEGFTADGVHIENSYDFTSTSITATSSKSPMSGTLICCSLIFESFSVT